MTERGTAWSLTIYNDDYKSVDLPQGWKLKGQLEICPTTNKEHYQGMLSTPQTRFSTIKKVFKEAHIELARNKMALASYVKKEDTRLQSIPDRSSDIPTLWDYSESLADKYIEEEFQEFMTKFTDEDIVKMSRNDMLLLYIDTLVENDIQSGQRGVEFIAINPMFRSAWKRFGLSMIKRSQIKPPRQETPPE